METTTTNALRTYDFILEGEKPFPLLKEHMEKLKVHEPESPVLNIKGYELVAVPEEMSHWEFVRNFLEHTAEPNKLYIIILKLGTKPVFIDEEQLTGKCKVNENIAKGARKWETKHVVYTSQHVKDMDGVELYDEKSQPILRNIELGLFDTKGDAMSYAKQHALDHNCETFVEIEKRLSGSVHRVADIAPQVKHVKERKEIIANQFLFFGKGE